MNQNHSLYTPSVGINPSRSFQLESFTLHPFSCNHPSTSLQSEPSPLHPFSQNHPLYIPSVRIIPPTSLHSESSSLHPFVALMMRPNLIRSVTPYEDLNDVNADCFCCVLVDHTLELSLITVKWLIPCQISNTSSREKEYSRNLSPSCMHSSKTLQEEKYHKPPQKYIINT